MARKMTTPPTELVGVLVTEDMYKKISILAQNDRTSASQEAIKLIQDNLRTSVNFPFNQFRGRQLNIVASPESKELWSKLAKDEGRKLSDFLCRILYKATERVGY